MSTESIISQLRESRYLVEFVPRRVDPDKVIRRHVFIAEPALTWCYRDDELKSRSPHVEAKPNDVQALLTRFMVDEEVDYCHGRRATCDIKRLDVSHLSVREVWELRTMPPDSCRIFGWFVLPRLLVLSHGESRKWLGEPRTPNKQQKRWDRQIRDTVAIRNWLDLPFYSSDDLSSYF